jgi:hypothetical protein
MDQINICIPAAVRTIQSRYNYGRYWRELLKRGQARFGSRFELYEQDAGVLIRLIAWVLRDEEVAAEKGMCLDKGILLCGNVGVGKTCIMQLLQEVVCTTQRFRMRSCRDISFDFSRQGINALDRFMNGSFIAYPHLPVAWCFDDLGLEMPVEYYGVYCNTMGEILLSRYDHFVQYGMLTHLTTNLNSAEITERYGIRLRSRMRQMFNLVSFDTGALDKRL